jgi:hypothetical protein
MISIPAICHFEAATEARKPQPHSHLNIINFASFQFLNVFLQVYQLGCHEKGQFAPL